MYLEIYAYNFPNYSFTLIPEINDVEY